MKSLSALVITVGVAVCTACTSVTPDTVDLTGPWKVTLQDGATDGIINLPGTTDMARYGFEVDTTALSRDEMFRRLTRRYSYIGEAVYGRDVTITPQMADKPLELTLERIIWKSTATIGGREMEGDETSLVAPHRHLLSDGLPAGTYRLEVTVDNTKQFDISTSNLAHCYTNDTQTIWNGILGEITLRALPVVDLKHTEIYPDSTLDSIRVVSIIENLSDSTVCKNIRLATRGASQDVAAELAPGVNRVSAKLAVTDLEHWNEFNPAIHTLTATLDDRTISTTYGLRHIDNTDGLRVNGVPVFLRGTLECCVFPLSGTPPTDRAGWLKTFGTARKWGLNHLRFHSWCPPRAAFEVADSLGFYLQVELPVWSLKIGDDPAAESFLRDEFERIVTEYGNHPSLCLISVGNELQHDFDWLNETVGLMKQRDPRHLYTTTSFTFEKGHGGHPEPADEFFVTQWTDNGWVRGQGVFETERPNFTHNYSKVVAGIDVPLISHEIGQYAVYPSMKEIDKYTGILNPLNFKNIRDDLASKGLLDKSEAMTDASARLAAILYKEEIERALKTDGMSGFQLLGLQDFPGQGTALVGLVDAFWDNKGAVDPAWFRQFSAPVVPLLNYEAAVYSTADTLHATAMIANFSDEPLPAGDAVWSLTKNGEMSPFATGAIAFDNLPVGKVSTIGNFSTVLDQLDTAAEVEMKLTAPGGWVNSWKIHVYPPVKPQFDNIVATRTLAEALDALQVGKRVLLAPSPDDIAGLESKFLPVFWSPVHFPKQAGTMGLMCDRSHPAFDLFPNQGHTDWQWWQLTRNAKTLVTDSLTNVTPIVGVIDNFVNNRRLAYVFEAKCGNGSLLFSSIDLLNPDIHGPELDAFVASLCQYASGDKFDPSGEITVDELSSLFRVTKTGHTNATSIYD